MRPDYSLQSNPLFHHNYESHPIDATWADYLKDCGGDKIIDNYIHSKLIFNEKYENNRVSWEGYFAEVKQRQKNVIGWGNPYALSILVKMDPTESTQYADLVLSIPHSLYQRNKSAFDSLKKGDGISFDAALVGLGNEFKMHHLRCESLEKNGKAKHFEDIIVRESSLPE